MEEQQEEICKLKIQLEATRCKKEIYKSKLAHIHAMNTDTNLTPESPRPTQQQVKAPSVSAKTHFTKSNAKYDPSLTLDALYTFKKPWSPPLAAEDSDEVQVLTGKREKVANGRGSSEEMKLSAPKGHELKKK